LNASAGTQITEADRMWLAGHPALAVLHSLPTPMQMSKMMYLYGNPRSSRHTLTRLTHTSAV